ncbi:MAG: sigma 54-interacting transcriptional regulator [Planctomycetota bacterium]
MPKIIIQEGFNRGAAYTLSEEKMTIGRDYANAIQLIDEKVSRVHAVLFQEGDRWHLSDLDSRNGTYVNDRRVKRDALKSGDRVRIGNVHLVFVDDEGDWKALAPVAATRELEVTETLAGGEIRLSSGPNLERANTRLLALVQLANLASTVKDLAGLMDVVVGRLDETLVPDRAVPVLLNPDGTYRTHERREEGERKRRSRVPLSTTVLEYARKTGASVLSEASQADDRFSGAKSVVGDRIASVLCAPVKLRERLFGFLYVDRLGEAAPFGREDLEFITAVAAQVAVALENITVLEELRTTQDLLEREVRSQFNIVGQTEGIRAVLDFIERAAPAEAGVLILGESGTGKELVARAIYLNSRRKGKPFEVVNCAALPETLLESELFGHAKGAFTGAHQDRKGRFELANGGVIFLDEIGELSAESQSKLLRVLENGEIRRLGDTANRRVDARVIVATNRDLAKAAREGKFREDLYYRLNVLQVTLPPLRERAEDLEPLTRHFLDEICRRCGTRPKSVDAEVTAFFRCHPWPGNIRELKNTLERMVILSRADTLTMADIPAEMKAGSGAAAPAGPDFVPCPLETIERRHVLQVLDYTKGNKAEAAKILGIDRSTLYAKLKGT